MHQYDHHTPVLLCHRHALPDTVEGRFGSAVGVRTAGAVIRNAADAGEHETDAAMQGEKEGREYCLGKRERAEDVGRKGAEENAVRGGFQTILLVRSRDAGKTETASAMEAGDWDSERCGIPANVQDEIQLLFC